MVAHAHTSGIRDLAPLHIATVSHSVRVVAGRVVGGGVATPSTQREDNKRRRVWRMQLFEHVQFNERVLRGAIESSLESRERYDPEITLSTVTLYSLPYGKG